MYTSDLGSVAFSTVATTVVAYNSYALPFTFGTEIIIGDDIFAPTVIKVECGNIVDSDSYCFTCLCDEKSVF